MKKALFITARLKSTRLPLKAIKQIKGRPMICHMIDRLKLARHPDTIVLCTSTIAQDDDLVAIARQSGIDYFRGDPDDVLVRLTNAAQQFNVDTVFSCTADNPFVDPEYADRMLSLKDEKGYDFLRCEGLPLGTSGYVVTFEAMKRACELKVETDTEIWGSLFTESGRFQCGVLKVDDPDLLWPDLRLTVDTPEDFALVTAIFDELYRPGEVFSLKEIVALCRRRPVLVSLNSNIQQRPAVTFTLKS